MKRNLIITIILFLGFSSELLYAQRKTRPKKNIHITTPSTSAFTSEIQELEKEYRWDDAVTLYKKQIDLLTKSKASTVDIEKKFAQAKLGAKMMQGVENLVIVDSIVVDKTDFLSAYKLGYDVGTLSTYKNYFKTNDDQFGTVYVNELGDRMMYSDEGKIYTRTHLINSWSTPQPLPEPVNMPKESSNYPFIQSDGTTLYYASTQNSLGGLDIFVTSNDSADSYLKPQNVGMPYNSPYNDYMLVIDDINNLGWFASDRYQPEGKVCVYLFIPNVVKKVYDPSDISPEELEKLAQIHAIKDTWVGRDSLVAEAKERLASVHTSKIKQVKDIVQFIINDHISYTDTNEFKSAAAKKHYQQYLALIKQLKEQTEKLEEMRSSYTKTDEEKKSTMAPGILDLERQISLLKLKEKEAVKTIRKMEIGYLNKK
jgi:hypothetical protein